MEKQTYFTERNYKNLEKLKDLLRELPYFVNEFFVGHADSLTPLTKLGYAQDFKCFFTFLINEVPEFSGLSMHDFTLTHLNMLNQSHIEQFLDYLSNYRTTDGKILSNQVKTKTRKFASIRALLKYFFKKDKITSNIADKVTPPKIREKEIVRLEIDEVSNLLNEVETGINLSKSEKIFHKLTEKRDVAILTLFLGTGIRISELVGLDIDDIDFKQNAFTITRKGGNRVILYFPDEVKRALLDYLDFRLENPNVDPNEKALFLSLHNKRICTRQVEKLVKKYSQKVTPLKHITPHKLRSTFGTNLYKETGDIYVVADVLGHKDVNTTKKYYAAITDDIRRNAVNKVKLRDA